MKMAARTSIFLWLAIMAVGASQSRVWSYEVETHSDISREAYELAKIDDFLAGQLGISGSKDKELRRSILERRRTAREWLRKGSKDEDDAVRFLNHFYDPIYNRGLTVLVPLGKRSHEWGLEAPQEIGGQEFSYRDAREYFRLSLIEADPKERERRLADTFYTLGHVIHLIQDSASPPHTRNAPHTGVIGPLSVVEKYLDIIRDDLKYDGYPIPKMGFTRPRDFWVETDASGTPRNGPDARGLSQIINRNFVSEGTNFTAFVDGNHAPEYQNPILNTADCYEELVNTQDAEKQPIRGLVTFCRNRFQDPNTGRLETNQRMTTFSLFGRDLQHLGFFVPQGFSLNALNAVSIGELTIPRAVAYSAGLLDYFFRGTLDFQVQASSTSPDQSRLTITNTSAEAMVGTFSLYGDDANGSRSPIATFNNLTLGPGVTSTSPLTFPAPTGVQAYVLVFQGDLGAEAGAVAGRFKRAPANTFFVWHVRFDNDQFDLVDRLSSAHFSTFLGRIQVVESFFSSGSHQGLRRHYLFFALVHDPNRPLPPLDVSDLGVTAQLSSAPSRASVGPFGSGAVGIIELEVPQLTICDPQISPRMLTVAGLFRSVETNHYLIGNLLMGPPPGPLDTGILASELLLTPTLNRVSFEQLQGIVRELHPLLTPPPSFPKTAAAYAVAQFDVPNVDSWTVSEGGNRCFVNDGSVLPPPTFASVVRVAAMWDVESVTFHLSDGTTILLSDELAIRSIVPLHQRTLGEVSGLIKGLTSNVVFGAEYQRTQETTRFSPFSSTLPPQSFFQSSRHNPADPFVPLFERRP